MPIAEDYEDFDDTLEDEDFAKVDWGEDDDWEKPADPDADLVVADEIPLLISAAERFKPLGAKLGHVHLSPWLATPGVFAIPGPGEEKFDTESDPQWRGWIFMPMTEEQTSNFVDLSADAIYPRRERDRAGIIGSRYSDKPVHDVELSRSLWSSPGFSGVGDLQRALPGVSDAGLPSLAQELLYFLDGCIARAESLSEQQRARERVAAGHAAYVARRDELVARNDAERARREAARERKREQGRALARRMKEKREREAALDRFAGKFPPGLRWFARWLWSRRNE
jgi:hypothetical protein